MESIYLDYAAGSLSPSARLLLDAHLALRPERLSDIALWEAVGGSLMEAEVEPLELMFLKGFDYEAGAQQAPVSGPGTGALAQPLPQPLANVIGKPVAEIEWISTLPGMKEYPVPGWPQARLLRLAAGRTIPRHSHGGSELTLVLEGSFSDHQGFYGRGDVCVADETVEHSPRVSADQECLCFAVIEGAYRPKGIWRLISAVNDMIEAAKARRPNVR